MKRLASAFVAALALTAYGTESAPEPTDVAGSGTPEQFVACLKSEGLDAKVSEWGGWDGLVMVRTGELDVTTTGGGGEVAITRNDAAGGDPIMTEYDDANRRWDAVEDSSFFAASPEIQDAYAACEARFPDFAQPEYDPAADPGMQEWQRQAEADALEFAACARESGFAWVADPDPEMGGNAIELPSTLTEGEYRSLLEACYDPSTALSWMTSDDLSFDWGAVLEEFARQGTN